MPELRRDPVIDRWVIIAEERSRRPFSPPGPPPAPVDDPACPFCEGAEFETPPEVAALRPEGSPPDGPGWRLRVVPNKFPALTGDGPVETTGVSSLYRSLTGVGVHEVIIETPRHAVRFSELSDDRIADLFRVVRDRFRVFAEDPRLVCAQFFKNHGASAGASLAHSHSQIIAMPVIARRLAEEMSGARRRHDETGGCVYCRMAADQRPDGDRLVEGGETITVMTPYAPRFAFETWLTPTRHASRFEESDDTTLVALAAALKRTLGRIETALDYPPYNLMLFTAPFDVGAPPWYHWRLEIIPVTGRPAGFEWGSGFAINPTSPEEAARQLRKL
jgi:UDPglucose--hexose-1-phosphate uridylyltransferase